MRISELQNKLVEIQGEFGNCHVIIDDKAQPEFRVITNFSVEEALVKDKSGDVHEVVSLVIPAEKAVNEESQKEELYDGMNYVQRLVREIEESEIDVPKVLFRLNEAAEKAKKAPSEKHKSENDEKEESQNPAELPGYFRELKMFHFLLIKQIRTMADMFEAHLSQVESSIDKLKKNSQ